jgi:hypothetical protein
MLFRSKTLRDCLLPGSTTRNELEQRRKGTRKRNQNKNLVLSLPLRERDRVEWVLVRLVV